MYGVVFFEFGVKGEDWQHIFSPSLGVTLQHQQLGPIAGTQGDSDETMLLHLGSTQPCV